MNTKIKQTYEHENKTNVKTQNSNQTNVCKQKSNERTRKSKKRIITKINRIN